MVEQEFTTVLASASDGDEVAFARIVDTHHDDMRGVCAVITRDQDLAEDAVQTAWSIVWRKIGSVREPAKLRPRLMRISVMNGTFTGNNADATFVASGTAFFAGEVEDCGPGTIVFDWSGNGTLDANGRPTWEADEYVSVPGALPCPSRPPSARCPTIARSSTTMGPRPGHTAPRTPVSCRTPSDARG